MEFETVVGLEIHVEMNTKSKMFSSAPIIFNAPSNTYVEPLDMAFPGTMPVVNKQAVINAIRMSNALHMAIDDYIIFDRKNYFYSDLAKGYQLTQHFRPIGSNGYLTFNYNGEERVIHIERLHMEEDTCKQIHSGEYTYLDFNRSGVPLIEIVTKPEIRNGEEASLFVEQIRSIATFLGVSRGRMEDGNIRVDVNVSLREKNSNKPGKKVEIKNINSFSNIKIAIESEIDRQTKILLSGKPVKQETRKYDDVKRQTVGLRNKDDEVDYRFFTDPNIAPIRLSKVFIEDAIRTSPELADARKARYIKLGLTEYDASIIVLDKETSDYFDEGLKSGCSAKFLANWIITDVLSILNKKNITISEFPIPSSELSKLVLSIEKGTINSKQAKDIFSKMISCKKSFDEILKEINIKQVSDDEILLLIKKIIDNEPQLVVDYKSGKDKVVGHIVGQVMKLTQSNANPVTTNKLTTEELKRR
jgi:aspartyl-tRNA(Asn)/glutamyl-tRNA(Gln) amidotransferase subunit B